MFEKFKFLAGNSQTANVLTKIQDLEDLTPGPELL